MNKYSEDLRQKVKKYLAKEGSNVSKAAKLFEISRTTIYSWIKSNFKLNEPKRTAYKLNEQLLEDEIANRNDIILRELSSKLDVSVSTVWYALKRMGYVKKKNPVTQKDVYIKDKHTPTG